MSSSAPKKSPWFTLIRDEAGYSGAQKALAALLVLGLILLVTRTITGGTRIAAGNAEEMLEQQSGNSRVVWSEQSGGGSPGGSLGSGEPLGGDIGSGMEGSSDSDDHFWSTVTHVVIGIGTVVAIVVAPEVVIPLMIADGILYTAEGDYVNAGLSFLGPAAEGVKILQSGIKIVEGSEEAIKLIQTTGEVVESVNAEKGILQEARAVEELATEEQAATRLAEKKKPLHALDSTGKVHGELPRPQDLSKYTKEELESLRDELKQSVQERIRKTVELGSDKGHGARQAAEQQLIKSIEKYLTN